MASTTTLRPRHLLIGATGSVASIKIPILIQQLLASFNDGDVEVRVVATDAAMHFFKASDIKPIEVLTDAREWQEWKRISDPVLHIELRNWADICVIAPLDANTLAKLANGLCDNLLTCILRAWDPSKPCMVCPAMNTFMWNHPLTSRHLSLIKDLLGYKVIDPISKKLACGDVGDGAMAEPETIIKAIHDALF